MKNEGKTMAMTGSTFDKLKALADICLHFDSEAEQEMGGSSARLVVMLSAELPAILKDMIDLDQRPESICALNTIVYLIRNLRPKACLTVEVIHGLGLLLGAAAWKLRERPSLNPEPQRSMLKLVKGKKGGAS
jgi:hypothetical protein